MMESILLIAIGVVAIYMDLKYRRIPNWLILIGVIGGLGIRTALGSDALLSGLLGLVSCMILMLPSHIVGGMGAGDVKLSAVFGLMLGLQSGIWALLLGALLGGVLAVCSIHKNGTTKSLFKTIFFDFYRMFAFKDIQELRPTYGKAHIPYGIPLSIGAIVIAIMRQSNNLI